MRKKNKNQTVFFFFIRYHSEINNDINVPIEMYCIERDK